MVAGCGSCFWQENVRPQIGLWATRTSSQINARAFNQSKNGIKSIQSKFSQHILACYNRAGVTRQLLTQTGNRGSGENVSCTWRLHPVDILVLLKNTSIWILACRNVHNNRNHRRSWTWGELFFRLGKDGEVLACWSKMRVGRIQRVRADENNERLHAKWTQGTLKSSGEFSEQRSNFCQRFFYETSS